MIAFSNGESSGVRTDKLNEVAGAVETLDNKNTELSDVVDNVLKSTLPIQDYKESGGGITSANTWTGVNSTTTTHIAIPVTPEDHLEVTAGSEEIAILAFVKSYEVPRFMTTPIEFSEQVGFTGRITIRKETAKEFIVPFDAYYVIVAVKWSGRRSLPVEFNINGYDAERSLIRNIGTLREEILRLEESSEDIEAIRQSVAQEINSRTDADNALDTRISNERTSRESADTRLDHTKLSLPSENNYGSAGQVPMSTGSGIRWSDIGSPTDEQVEATISRWLNEHPEATTSVQDGSVSLSKLGSDVTDLLEKLENGGTAALVSSCSSVVEVQSLIDSGEYDGIVFDSDIDLGNTPLRIPSDFVLKGGGGIITFDDQAFVTVPSGIDGSGNPTYKGASIGVKNRIENGLTVPYTEGDRRIYLADGVDSTGLLGKTLRIRGTQDLLVEGVDEEYRLGVPTGAAVNHKECHAGTYSEVVNSGSDDNGNYIIISPELQWYYGQLEVNEWFPCKNVVFSGLELKCNRTSGKYNAMLSIADADNVLIENCKIIGVNVMCEPTRSQHVTVRRCWFDVNVDDYNDPDFYKNNVMHIVGSLYCVVEQCHFSGSAQCIDITFSSEGFFSYGCVVRDNFISGSRNTTTTHPGTAACTVSGNRMLSRMNGIGMRGQRHIVKDNVIKFLGDSEANDPGYYGINWDEGNFRRSVCHGNTIIGFGTGFYLRELFDIPNERYSVYPSSVGINITGNVIQDCMYIIRILRVDGLGDGRIATETTKQDTKLNLLFSGNLVFGKNPIGNVAQSLLYADGVITATDPATYTKYNSVSNILIQNNAIFTQGGSGSQAMRIVNSTIPIRNLVIANNDFGDSPVYLGYLGAGINGSSAPRGSAVDCTFFNNKYRVIGRVASGDSYVDPKNLMSGDELPLCADIGAMFYVASEGQWYRFEINRGENPDSQDAAGWVPVS